MHTDLYIDIMYIYNRRTMNGKYFDFMMNKKVGTALKMPSPMVLVGLQQVVDMIELP